VVAAYDDGIGHVSAGKTGIGDRYQEKAETERAIIKRTGTPVLHLLAGGPAPLCLSLNQKRSLKTNMLRG
jgi:hypothetical protein